MTPPSTAARHTSNEDAAILWRRYSASGDPALRERLILTFAPLVKYIVYKKVREMPARCDVEDYLSCGLEALIGSIDRFDPARGATLEQFAWTRIHGAVLDELRRQDFAPRSVRRWERDIERAQEAFTALHRRRPSHEELADSLHCTVADLRRHRDEIAVSDTTSLNTLVVSGEDSAIERLETLASSDLRTDPEHAAAVGDAKQRFRDAFALLPRRDREIAVLLYVKNHTLAEIGLILDVSESRVCQIHGALKKTLRASLDSHESLFRLVA